jgi:hypothetical protein
LTIGVQEVPGSNPGGPTKSSKSYRQQTFTECCFGVQVESKVDAAGRSAGSERIDST